MTRSNHSSYSVKVWLFSAIVTPFLFSIFACLIDRFDASVILFSILYAAPAGILLSIPCLFILIFSTWKINTSSLTITEKKVFINGISIICTYLLFHFILIGFHLGSHQEIWFFTIGYGITLTFAIWYTKLTLEESNIDKNDVLQNQIFLEDILDDENY